MKRFLILLACAAATVGAAAQPVYKCTVNGKVSYGERPCADGKTIVLAAPAAGDAEAAQAAASGDKAALAALEKERTAHLRDVERTERERLRAARAADTARQKCERLRLKQRWAEEDAARADGQRAQAARLKAKRQGEALAVECPG